MLALIGTGVQARSHVRALTRVRDFTEIRIAGRDPAKAGALAQEVGGTAAGLYEEAIRGAHVVAATTHSTEPVVRREWLSPGAHVNSVGLNPSGREVDDATVADAMLVVESRESALAPPPAGAPDLAGIDPAHVHAELGELVSGARPGRTSPEQISLYKSVGVAVQDAAAATLVLAAARGTVGRPGDRVGGIEMSSNNDFKAGLEGVVAVETEIAEPDREGGSLRYRGVDIEELVGKYPYENVWGLLVDDDLHSKMPDPEPYEPARLTGNAPSDLQAETARLAGEWKLGKLNEISDEQAREDLGRLSAQMMSIVARSARVADGKTDVVPDDVVAKGQTAAETFLLRWRGEADPRHVRAIDTYWICTAEHGLDASTFAARVTASTGADCGAALSSAVGALSGPLHGGAPAYVKPMLEEVARMGDAEKWVGDTLAAGKRIMGFGHRVYRAEDPRSRVLKRTAKELGAAQFEVAEQLERVALEALREKSPDRPLETNVEYYSAIVLDVAEIPPPLAPAMFACSRVAGWSAHILEQKRTGRLFRPSARYVGPAERHLN